MGFENELAKLPLMGGLFVARGQGCKTLLHQRMPAVRHKGRLMGDILQGGQAVQRVKGKAGVYAGRFEEG